MFVSISFETASTMDRWRRTMSGLVINWRTCSRSRFHANVSRSYAFGAASSTLVQRNMIRGSLLKNNLLRCIFLFLVCLAVSTASSASCAFPFMQSVCVWRSLARQWGPRSVAVGWRS